MFIVTYVPWYNIRVMAEYFNNFENINLIKLQQYYSCLLNYLEEGAAKTISITLPSGARTNAGVPNIGVDKRWSVKILIFLGISIQVRIG